MKIVAIADTHSLHDRVKIHDAEVLIVAGDICGMGRFDEIVIAGNHDAPLEHEQNHAQSFLTRGVPKAIF